MPLWVASIPLGSSFIRTLRIELNAINLAFLDFTKYLEVVPPRPPTPEILCCI